MAGTPITVALQQRITGAGYDVVKTEAHTFDGQRGYSLGQGD